MQNESCVEELQAKLRVAESELAAANELVRSDPPLSALGLAQLARARSASYSACQSELAAERARVEDWKLRAVSLAADVVRAARYGRISQKDDAIVRAAVAIRTLAASPPVASVATAEPLRLPCATCESLDCPRSILGPDTYCDGYKRQTEQVAPAVVEQPERMLGPDAKLRAEIVAAAREAGADRFPWVRFANLLEGKEP